ncbi:B-box zinc finger protein [Myxococcaceae bacterium GXIMD 01537]
MEFGSAMAGGALCPRHPDLSATRTCTRCGTFMCDVCSERGATAVCPECKERSGHQAFPLNRGNWTFSALWDHCFEAFKREWVMLSVSMLCVMVISGVANFIGGLAPLVGTLLDNQVVYWTLYIFGTALQTLVNGVLMMGYLRVVYDVFQGQRADVGRIFSQLHKTGRFALAMLMTVLMVVIPLGVVAGLLAAGVHFTVGFKSGNEAALLTVGLIAFVLLIVPLLYVTLPLYLLQPAIALEDDDLSATDTIRHCYEVARGERMSVLGVGFMAGLVTLAGLVACCVGIIPAMALGQMLIAGMYMALRSPSDA